MAMEAARVVKPGQILARELEARGWSQKDLAEIMGRPIQAVNEIVGGSKQITPNTAHELAQVFGTSPEFWMNLETNYRLHLAQKEPGSSDIPRRSRVYNLAPVKELIKRGWIKTPDSINELEKRVCSFLEIASPEEEPAFEVAVSRRHSVERGPVDAAQIAMLKRAEHLAAAQKVGRFDRKKFRAAIPQLLDCAKDAKSAARVPKFLMDLGVHFVIVPSLPQSFLDGATFNPAGNPIVALSLRYDRIDNFWFTLMHEVAHVDGAHRGIFIDNDIKQDAKGSEEKEADASAQDWLIEATRYQAFVRAARPYFSRRSIVTFAQEIGRHPGIVLGRLHHEQAVHYAHLRPMLERVRPILAGWVDVAHA
ncbi:MAG: HigA family addiction module antidote protein [Elusimicrobia bacterium]|nr:HigA family addiction module antidote protein [Elusimicrobiota bacterium]